MLHPDTLLQNRYRVVRRIGQGGMGAVYEARHEELGHTVALKETLHTDDESLRQAFRREARLLAGLRHPALPRVTDYFTEGDGLYLIMEFIPGDDLAELLRRRGGPFPPGDVLGWAERLLGVLGYLHNYAPPIIHRDIKPSNIKLTTAGEVFLLDFGLAKGSTTTAVVVSLPGATLGYAPLEQIHQTGTDARSDLFSLAATLYHLLTGVMAPTATLRHKESVEGRPDPLRLASELNPLVPPAVADALRRAMSLRLEDRPPSAADLGRMLRDAAPSIPGEPEQPPTVLVTRTVTREPGAEAAPPRPAALKWRLAREWEAHTSEAVASVVISPDAGLVASACDSDKTVKLWDAATGQLKAKLIGAHTLWVEKIAFSPGGHLLASAGLDEAVVFWEARTGEARRRVNCQVGRLYSVAFSPDGGLLAVGGSKAIEVLDAGTFESRRVWEAHSGVIASLAFSPDGQTLASGSWDSNVKLWDVRAATLRRALLLHDGYVRAVAFSPDGRTLASAGTDKTIRLWDVPTGRPRQVLKGHGDPVEAVAFSPDGGALVSGGRDLRLWDARTGELRQTLADFGEATGRFRALAFSRDGGLLAGGAFNMIRLWEPDDAAGTKPATAAAAVAGGRAGGREVAPDAEGVGGTWALAHELRGHTRGVVTVAFSHDGRTLASGSSDFTARLWHVETGELRETLIGHKAGVRWVVFSPDGRRLASGGEDGRVKLWEVETGELLETFDDVSPPFPLPVFLPDGDSLAVASNHDYALKIWDTKSGTVRHRLTGHGDSVNWLDRSPDGRMLASASSDKTVRLWDVETGRLLRTLEGHGREVNWVCFSPGGGLLASAGSDKMVRLWGLPGGEPARALKGHDDIVYALLFSPDGRTLASGSNDNTVNLWDVQTGKLRHMLAGYCKERRPVAFSPDGRTLASMPYGHTVTLWEVETGALRQTLAGHSSSVYAVNFSPDGRHLASGGYADPIVRLWGRAPRG